MSVEVYICGNPKTYEKEARKRILKENRDKLKELKESDPNKVAIIAYNKYLDAHPYLPFKRK